MVEALVAETVERGQQTGSENRLDRAARRGGLHTRTFSTIQVAGCGG